MCALKELQASFRIMDSLATQLEQVKAVLRDVGEMSKKAAAVPCDQNGCPAYPCPMHEQPVRDGHEAMDVIDSCLQHIGILFEEHNRYIDRALAILIAAHPEIGKFVKNQEVAHPELRKILEEFGAEIGPDPEVKMPDL